MIFISDGLGLKGTVQKYFGTRNACLKIAYVLSLSSHLIFLPWDELFPPWEASV